MLVYIIIILKYNMNILFIYYKKIIHHTNNVLILTLLQYNILKSYYCNIKYKKTIYFEYLRNKK